MKKKFMLMIVVCLFLIGCKSVAVVSTDESQAALQKVELKDPYMVFEDTNSTYKIKYNAIQRENSRDREEIAEAEPLFIENFKKTKNNMDLSQRINVVPVSMSATENQNGKFLMLNILVINNSDKIITNFFTDQSYTFLNNPLAVSDSIEMANLAVEQLNPKEGVLVSYGIDITDQPSDFYTNLTIEDISIKSSDIHMTTK